MDRPGCDDDLDGTAAPHVDFTVRSLVGQNVQDPEAVWEIGMPDGATEFVVGWAQVAKTVGDWLKEHQEGAR